MIALTDRFSSLFVERGFQLEAEYDFSGSRRFIRTENGQTQYISWLGNSQNGGQMILARGGVTQRWPFPDRRTVTASYVEARSPFFYIKKDIFTDCVSDPELAEKVGFWLDSIGVKWLGEPDLFTDEQWAEGGIFTGKYRRNYWTNVCPLIKASS